MRLDHSDYIKLVKAAYQKKQLNNEQPLLTRPTPGSIRREYLRLFPNRFKNSDEPMLRAFFAQARPETEVADLITNFQTGGFKTLSNFLTGKTESTDPVNLELLAWLIDFPHRPWALGKNVVLSEEEKLVLNNETIVDEEEIKNTAEAKLIDDESSMQLANSNVETKENLKEKISEGAIEVKKKQAPGNDSANNNPRKNIWRWVTASLIFILGSGGIYGIVNSGNNTGCMYWNGDSFEKIACDEPISSGIIIPIDNKRLKTLKRITRPDTLTEKDIGKVYYIKENKSIEYYTQGGAYPQNPGRSLKKLSRHIYETYLDKKPDSSMMPPVKINSNK